MWMYSPTKAEAEKKRTKISSQQLLPIPPLPLHSPPGSIEEGLRCGSNHHPSTRLPPPPFPKWRAGFGLPPSLMCPGLRVPIPRAASAQLTSRVARYRQTSGGVTVEVMEGRLGQGQAQMQQQQQQPVQRHSSSSHNSSCRTYAVVAASREQTATATTAVMPTAALRAAAAAEAQRTRAATKKKAAVGGVEQGQLRSCPAHQA
jgi:hypothetical protein